MAYGNKSGKTVYGPGKKATGKMGGGSGYGSTFGAYGPGKKMGSGKGKQLGGPKMVGGVTNSGSVG